MIQKSVYVQRKFEIVYGSITVIGRALHAYVQQAVHDELYNPCVAVLSQLPNSGLPPCNVQGMTQFGVYLAQLRSSRISRRHSFDIACYAQKRQVLGRYGQINPCGDHGRAGRLDGFSIFNQPLRFCPKIRLPRKA